MTFLPRTLSQPAPTTLKVSDLRRLAALRAAHAFAAIAAGRARLAAAGR